jgi:hypothetical protein
VNLSTTAFRIAFANHHQFSLAQCKVLHTK